MRCLNVEFYLVGGAVRDALLGLPVHERDYVVVNAEPAELLSQGYQPVGKDFPVFLHPETKEEYALARTERKTGKGYKGFECYAAPDVTLEDDLIRRDLTINAMAQTESGDIIDPYGGMNDIKNKVLRHVSPAFREDPLRVLRLARFAARFSHLGFTIAEETQVFLREMVRSGELSDLVPERVWLEVEKVLKGDSPDVFFNVLRQCGALAVLFPELDALFGVPATLVWHPEIDSGVHTLMVLAQAADLTSNTAVRFAALVHDLGKGVTPQAIWPSHRGHDITGLDVIDTFCQRYPVPKSYRDLAKAVCRYHINTHQIEELKTTTILKILHGIDAFRRPERLEQFLLAVIADSQGRLGSEDEPYPQADRLRSAYQAASAVDVKEIVDEGYQGEAIAEQLRLKRIKAIDKA